MTSLWKRKRSALKIALFVSALLASVVSSWAGERVRIGYPSTSALWWPIFVAKERGFYQERGFDAELVLIRGAPTVVQALVAGEIDFAGVGTIAALTAYFRGAPIVAVSGVIGKSPFQIYSVPEVDSVPKLRGKAVAIGAAGGPPDYAITTVLKAFGIEIGKDVKGIYMGSSGARLAALENRQVAATVLSPPFTFQAKTLGFRKLVDARDFIPNDQNDVIVASREVIKNKPEKARGFVRATIKAMRFIVQNREVAIEILGKYSKQPRAALEETHDFFVPSISEKINTKGIDNIVWYIKGRNMPGELKNTNDFMDLRFVQ